MKERKEGKPWGFRPDLHKTASSTTEDGLVEAWHFGFRTKMDCTTNVAKSKSVISCAVTALLICAFVFLIFSKVRFSYHRAKSRPVVITFFFHSQLN